MSSCSHDVASGAAFLYLGRVCHAPDNRGSKTRVEMLVGLGRFSAVVWTLIGLWVFWLLTGVSFRGHRFGPEGHPKPGQ